MSAALLLAACSVAPPTTPSLAPAPSYAATVLLGDTTASALAVGPDGTIYFVANEFDARSGNGNGQVRYLSPGASAAQTLPGSSGPGPIGAVALDIRGSLYITRTSNAVASANAVYRYEQNHFVLVAGGGPSLEPRGSATAVQLQGPVGLAFYTDGQIAIAEYGDNRILRVSPSGLIDTFVGTGRCASGLTPPADGRADGIAVCGPWSIAIDQDSIMYIAPYESDWVLRVDRTGNARAIAGFGKVTAIAAGKGGVFVADVGGGRILRVEPRSAIADGLATPRAIAIDSSGNLVVATQQNSQLIKLASR